MKQALVEQQILEAISRHAAELTEAEVSIDGTFFKDLETALSRAYLAKGLDRSGLRVIQQSVNRLQVDLMSAKQSP